MSSELIMKGKLKTFDEVKEISSKVKNIDLPERFVVYHSKVSMNILVFSSKSFGSIIDIKSAGLRDYGRIYEDENGQLYYDEWFEWIGEEPPIIEPLPESLWDISDW